MINEEEEYPKSQFSTQKVEALKQNKNHSLSAVITKIQEIGIKLQAGTPAAFSPLTSLSNALLTSNDGTLRNYRFPSPSPWPILQNHSPD